MYARVTRWEGQSQEQLEEIAKQIQGGDPPPGVPASGATLLADEDGNSLMIVVFATEEDMRAGDEAMSAMSPDEDAPGRRVSKELFRVLADERN